MTILFLKVIFLVVRNEPCFYFIFFSPDNSEVLQWARKRKIPSIQHDALLGLVQFTVKFEELNTILFQLS